MAVLAENTALRRFSLSSFARCGADKARLHKVAGILRRCFEYLRRIA
jgi:hypothetical protein